MLSAAPLPGSSLIIKTLKDRRMLVMVTAIQQFRETRDQRTHLVSSALSCQPSYAASTSGHDGAQVRTELWGFCVHCSLSLSGLPGSLSYP